MDTAAEKVSRRSAIESEHNGLRSARETEFHTAKVALEDEYHADLAEIESDKRAAMRAAGLNSDGSDPQGRPQH